VRSGAIPNVEIPTDDHLKKFGLKLPKPDKEEVVAATRENKRFREENKEEMIL
jgi:hypothetical protein